MAIVLLAIGLVLCVEGLVFALAPSRLEDLLDALRQIPVETRRTIGLAALSKTAGLLLGVYAGVVLVWLAWRDDGWRALPRKLFWLVAPILLLAGWLWWRNWTLYGDLTAANQFVRLAGGDRGYTLWQVLGESDGLWKSLFAIFGWFNVRPPGWILPPWVSCPGP